MLSWFKRRRRSRHLREALVSEPGFTQALARVPACDGLADDERARLRELRMVGFKSFADKTEFTADGKPVRRITTFDEALDDAMEVAVGAVTEVGNPTVLATWAVIAAIVPMAFGNLAMFSCTATIVPPTVSKSGVNPDSR